jgi:hypothetical protein
MNITAGLLMAALPFFLQTAAVFRSLLMWRFITFNERIRSLTAPESCWLTHKTGPHFYDQRALGAVTDKGYYRVDSPFGNGSTLGFTQQQFWNDGNLRWLQLDTNKYGLPGADFLKTMREHDTHARNIGMQSGIWMFSTVPEILSGAQHQHRKCPALLAF